MAAGVEEGVYFVVNNIPVKFRSADLRNYFSQFIESGGFLCFHYRHRPEVRIKPGETERPEGAPTVQHRINSEDDRLNSENDRLNSENDRLNSVDDRLNSENDRLNSVDDRLNSEDDRLNSEDDRLNSENDRLNSVDDRLNSEDDRLNSENDLLNSEDDRLNSEENQKDSENQTHSNQERNKSENKCEPACCCVVSVRVKDTDRFVKMYAGNQWIDSHGNWLPKRCLIRKIKVSEYTDPDIFPYKTKAELRRPAAHTVYFTKSHLKALSELNPPHLMPGGNVGTPLSVFLHLIQSCRFPPRLIRKLGLTFPKTGSNRRYGNVPFHYNTGLVTGGEESVFTASGAEICGPGRVPPLKSSATPKNNCGDPIMGETVEAECEEEEEQSGPDDDDDGCEEWERHEALHDDVTSQDRTKERLYEEEIELKWEKGGSGLVFYTDAQYWQEEEGDFDEQTADDWDVDMSVYYDKDGGDMDSKDYVRMRYENRLRDGLEHGSSHQKIGIFEKFTKGVGRRVMEKQGWKEGEGLGHTRSGIAEALENEGQHPKCKRGFGYHGEKLSSFQPLKRPRPDFHITTVYDEPKDIDHGDTLLRRQPSTSMKHTHWHMRGQH